MTATYWEIGRRIVEFEQGGKKRAEYGKALLKRLSRDLVGRFGRGFSERNLEQMRLFYEGWPFRRQCLRNLRATELAPPSSTISTGFTDEMHPLLLSNQFPLPWSHYVRLLSVKNLHARAFYEAEAIRGGWSVRQLDRQINSMFYERTALSRNKASMLTKGAKPKA